jgi:hypothetical protein
MIDRNALRIALQLGPVNALEVAKRLGYSRTVSSNGTLIIVNGTDYVHAPSFSLRQADAFFKAWKQLRSI